MSKLLHNIFYIHPESLYGISANPADLSCKSCYMPPLKENVSCFFGIGRQEGAGEFKKLTREEVIALPWKVAFNAKCNETEIEERDLTEDPPLVRKQKVSCFPVTVEYTGHVNCSRPLFCEDESQPITHNPTLSVDKINTSVTATDGPLF